MKYPATCLLFLALMGSAITTHAVGPGDIAPPFTGTNLVDGKTVEFPALLQGKPAVVVFWATWCPYCKAFMPFAGDIQADYADAGVQIVTLNSKERGRGDPKAYVDSLDFPMFAIADADAIGEAYSINFIPGLLVVDGTGQVVYRRRSTNLPAGKTVSAQWADEVRQVLDKLVRQRPAASFALPFFLPFPCNPGACFPQSKTQFDLGQGMSNRAAAIAVMVAFVIGILGSLAIRPTGKNQHQSVSTTGTDDLVRINWRLPVAFQTTMPVLGDNPIYLADMLRRASNGAVNLQIFEPGEIVPAFSITDAVRDRKVEAGYTWVGYDQGKIPASPLFGAVPFGMEPWEYSAWWFEAGGRELAEALYANHNIYPIYCGMTGPETAGWFRKQITSLSDVEGLKIRFAGLGGKVLERLGASVTMLPGGEIFQALEKGAIDASEFALPIVDQSLGFNRVAKFNYYPGWHQPFTASHLIINLEAWSEISAQDQALIELGCTAGVIRNLSNSEAKQGAIIAGFPDIGVSAEVLPEELLRELQIVAGEVIAEEAAADADFAEILASQMAFRKNYSHWKSRAYLPRDF